MSMTPIPSTLNKVVAVHVALSSMGGAWWCKVYKVVDMGGELTRGRQWETVGDSGRQWETVGDSGRQWETVGYSGIQWECVRSA
jgi:hypothetical protein